MIDRFPTPTALSVLLPGVGLAGALPAAPQIIPSNSEAVIVGGTARSDGALNLASLDLGSGGVRAVRVAARQHLGANRSGTAVTPGRAVTPGGVLVRAKSAGVKFDFPSGREVLVSPDGRIHLRTGERTLPFFSGIRVLLADGAFVTIRRGANSRRPLASVELTVDGRVRRLWSGTRRVRNASHTGGFVGTSVLALGDGGTFFTASAAGPLLGLSRVLCPKDKLERTPRRRLVVLGDRLAESLRLLPKHAPRRSVQFPQVAEAARRFAALGHLFAGKTARPPGAVGQLWFQLRDEYRLKVESTKGGVLVLGLYRGESPVPGVEWTIGGKSMLHFVRPLGGTRGGPRYFTRGVDLRELESPLLPQAPRAAQRAELNRIVTALGGRRPNELDVRRQD